MRPLNGIEASVVRWFAEHVPEPQRHSLLQDLENAVAETTNNEQLTIRFEIGGYSRPEHHLERPLPLDTVVLDADGAKLDVTLATDKNGRLLELQILRFERGPVIGPDWQTLRLRRPDEVMKLNGPENPQPIKP